MFIEINTDNAAFDSPDEIKRILSNLSGNPEVIKDINGNKVGSVKHNNEDLESLLFLIEYAICGEGDPTVDELKKKLRRILSQYDRYNTLL